MQEVFVIKYVAVVFYNDVIITKRRKICELYRKDKNSIIRRIVKMLSPKLETERLIVRRYEESDIDAIYDIITDKRLTKYIKFPKITRDEELECIRKWISEADESKYERWVIERKSDGSVVGNIDVNAVSGKHNYCNVGYAIRYDYWGNGYAAEALKIVSEHLLNNSGYYLVECSCNELNTQSSKVMLKAGFKKDGYIANRRLNNDGTYSGVEYYSKRKN